MAIALASLEIALKQAPQHGWLSPSCGLLLLLGIAAATLFAVRTLKAVHPGGRLVDARDALVCDRLRP